MQNDDVNEPATPERPYTDADLRAEAARQHAKFTAEPDEGIVGEVMEDGYVPSVETDEDGSARTWAELLEPDGDETPEYAAAQQAVCDLIRDAADVSMWAVTLGADGLEADERVLTIAADGKPFARVHLAFAADYPDEGRDGLIYGIAEAMADAAQA
jgi:hypothetical protein